MTVVRLANHCPVPFSGWISTTIDELPEHLSGSVSGCDYVVGRAIGLDCWAIDVRVSLAAGQQKAIDLQGAEPRDFVLPALPTLAHFGGALTVGGVALSVASLRPDGAAYLLHARGRFGRMLQADVWLRWYPDQPAWCRGEAIITASNPDVPDMTAEAFDCTLRFGDALVFVVGAGLAPLVPAGTRFGDGQARAVPFLCIWPRHMKSAAEWSSIGVAAEWKIGALGLSRLYPDGTPTLPTGFDVRGWAAQHWERSLRELHSWTSPQLGPAADTGQTGAVEDQCFVGGEPFVPGGVGAEQLRHLAALKTAGHPMHHLEVDGTVVDRDRRPNLRMFYSRPHSSGSDRLGKPRDLQVTEASGWNGSDAQHWTINTLSAAARLTGSPALQRLLEHHARNYLIQLTTTPGASTSAIWSARELGWEGIAAVRLWQCLEDRALADRVRAHWQQRVQSIIVPKLGAADVWDVRVDDARLGQGQWWMPWQQALGVYGIDYACETFGIPEGRALALRGAKKILADTWLLTDGRWLEFELLSLDGLRLRSGMFADAWLPLAVATVLRHEPGNERARSIWAQIAEDAKGNGRWIPPTRS